MLQVIGRVAGGCGCAITKESCCREALGSGFHVFGFLQFLSNVNSAILSAAKCICRYGLASSQRMPFSSRAWSRWEGETHAGGLADTWYILASRFAGEPSAQFVCSHEVLNVFKCFLTQSLYSVSQFRRPSLSRWKHLASFGILPKNGVQLLRIHCILTRKIHLTGLACARSFLVIHLVEQSAAKVLVISFKGRLGSGPRKWCRHDWCVPVEQVHRRKPQQFLHGVDHTRGRVEVMVNKRRPRLR